MKQQAKGFTLIELIVVLLILAILGATVAPKMFDLTGQARIAALKSLNASVSSAAQLAHALQVAQGLAANANVTVEGSAVTMVNGYPAASAAGIGAAITYDTTVFSATGAAPYTFQVTNAPTPTTCQFTYTAAVSPNPPAIQMPPLTAGC